MRRAHHLPRLTAIALATLALALTTRAGAQEPEVDEIPHLTPPPAPEDREPDLLVEVRTGGIIPLERTDICPGDAFCVLGGGGHVGAIVERRWPFGLGVFVAYDAWFVDSGGVFELGVVQSVRAGVRYILEPHAMVHPVLHLGAGALVFGDTLLVSTVGGAIELGVGVEIELTPSVAATAGVAGWLFTTSPFTTDRDATARSEGLGLNVALQLNVGLVILAESGDG